MQDINKKQNKTQRLTINTMMSLVVVIFYLLITDIKIFLLFI